MRKEWFHGRFIVVPGACVVTSDRSMDFVAVRERSVGGVSERTIALLDNLLVRWPLEAFSPEEIAEQWSQLSPEFSGPPITVGNMMQ
jgi:hypothetical protein